MTRLKRYMIRKLLCFLLAFLFFPFVVPAESQPLTPTPTPAPVLALPAILQPGGFLFLVNRAQKVSKEYAPKDLVQPNVKVRKESLKNNILMRADAARGLEKMFEAAWLEEGYRLYAASGYRSFGIQQILYSSKVEEMGSKAKAERRVAPPGASEHQLGLAMDVQSSTQLNLNAEFGKTDEGKWVAKNAHRFGFILRYKDEWREITGYSEEPWHIRYLGIAHASAVYLLDIPFETYIEQVKQLPEFVLTGGNHLLLAGLVRQMIAGESSASLEILRNSAEQDYETSLREASEPFLEKGTSYEQTLWFAYPTPKPTSAPRVDQDEETVLFPQDAGA